MSALLFFCKYFALIGFSNFNQARRLSPLTKVNILPDTGSAYPNATLEAAHINQELLDSLAERANRKDFLRTLADALHPVCNFSWLTVSLQGQGEEMFADFSAPGKRQINPFSPVLPQSLTSTISEYIQDTKGNLIIPDCIEYFMDMATPPIFRESVASVIAFPLMLNNEIVAALLLSYENRPDNLYKVASFVSGVCSTVAASLGVILSVEHMRHRRGLPEMEEEPPLPPLEQAFDASVVFRSSAMREVIRQISVLTNLDVPVLLLGETGTGKSMIARHIHNNSLRKSGRFVRVNCPSLASSLFESEMFGHAKGSFTGATKNRVGRFELAHKGTLFLDEVAELSLDMQSKLLQVLDDSSFERVGESVPIMVDMRIVAATNVHIGDAISQGRLRSDLFHRISVYTIELPPLRQRPEDIAHLAMVLSAQSAARLGLPDIVYSRSVMSALSEYYWPGNTRELSNLMTRLVIVQSVHGELTPMLVGEVLEQSESYFLAENSQAGKEAAAAGNDGLGWRPGAAAQSESDGAELVSLADMERRHIEKILKHTGGVIAGPKGAAKILGMPRSTLIHRMHKLGIQS
ncbi:hydrogenase [Deltaproteobacteria bacterium Smac51]|nr:hydrogenase [Deltaproteobacteria bacterium Smac51]